MKKILLVSYNHQNIKLADAIQNSRLVGLLSEEHIVTVVTRGDVNKIDDIVSIKSPNLKFVDRIIYKIFPFLFPVFSFDKFIWSIVASIKIGRLSKEFDNLLLTYEPYAVFIFQKLMRAKFKNCISVLYDPLSVNLYFPSTKIARFLQERLERKIINNSDKIILNNALTYKYYSSKYKVSDKFKCISMCSPALPISNDNGKNLTSKRKMVFAGNIHGHRNLKYLNDVITIIKQEYPLLKESLSIEFYGTYRDSDVNISKSNLDIIDFKGFCNQEELSKNLKKADAFLMIEAMEGCNYSLPSKVLDYLVYKKPIFAFTSRESAIYELLQPLGHVVCDNKSLDAMVNSFCDYFIKSKPLYITYDQSCFNETILINYNSLLV